jgi:hypothetical protein
MANAECRMANRSMTKVGMTNRDQWRIAANGELQPMANYVHSPRSSFCSEFSLIVVRMLIS